WRRSAAISFQGGFELTKICRCSRAPGAASREPAGTATRPRAGFRCGTLAPHVRQNACVKRSASGTLYDTTSSSPRSQRKSGSSANKFDACAAARAFRQREQWQFAIGPATAPPISYATPPQRQLPRALPANAVNAAQPAEPARVHREGGRECRAVVLAAHRAVAVPHELEGRVGLESDVSTQTAAPDRHGSSSFAAACAAARESSTRAKP